MKIQIILIMATLFLSCSKEDSCEDKKAEINRYFDERLSQTNDTSQRSALQAERQIKLSQACN